MIPPETRLIQNVEVNGRPRQDVLIRNGRIACIDDRIDIDDLEALNGGGGILLPGLKDHHLHLAAMAVARNSLNCRPHLIPDEEAFSRALRMHEPAEGWLRGIGYHPSIAGDIDATWLDVHGPKRPVRIQHQGGRLWVMNSEALQRLQVTEADPLERVNGKLTGRLYDDDPWLRTRMQALGEAALPDLSAVSHELAAFGITGLTDTSPANNTETLAWFSSACLLQDVLMMGSASLDGAHGQAGIRIGAHKFHLLESALPALDVVVTAVRCSHGFGRNVAFHCVTRTELAFALAALKEAGVLPGDRIEHASVTPPEWLEEIRALGLTVVTQPALVRERGDRYLQDVDADDLPWLYRLRAFLEAGVPLAGSSDAPYTRGNPWIAMQAAVDRRTREGAIIGAEEALTPEQALALYTGPLEAPGSGMPMLKVGDVADLCLLAESWQQARRQLGEVNVRLTLKAGEPIAGWAA